MIEQRRMRWLWSGASDVGARAEQQDRWGVFALPEDGLLAVVADGMGGHLDGALAAQTVLDMSARFVREQGADLRARPEQALQELCDLIQAAINERSPLAHSTVVMLCLCGTRAFWGYVGDSRCYHFRTGQRLMRTRDHSAVQLLFDLGQISEQEMATHPAQNRLYRSLGGEEPPTAELGRGQCQADDLFVLCSDGVWEYISDEEFWRYGAGGRLKSAAHKLVELAVERGENRADNATLVLIKPVEKAFWLRRLIGR